MSNNPSSDFLRNLKAAITHAEATEKELENEKFRNAQLEMVLKMLARRSGGILTWTRSELEEVKGDDRCLLLGALDLGLYSERRES